MSCQDIDITLIILLRRSNSTIHMDPENNNFGLLDNSNSESEEENDFQYDVPDEFRDDFKNSGCEPTKSMSNEFVCNTYKNRKSKSNKLNKLNSTEILERTIIQLEKKLNEEKRRKEHFDWSETPAKTNKFDKNSKNRVAFVRYLSFICFGTYSVFIAYILGIW